MNDDFAAAIKAFGVNAQEAAEAMRNLAQAAVDWSQVISAIAVLFDDPGSVFPDIGVSLTPNE